MAETELWEALESQREELLSKKKNLQADLISHQQEIRMRLEYVEQDLERLKKERDDAKEELSYLQNHLLEAREDERYQKEQENFRRKRKRTMDQVGLLLMLGSVALVLTGIYVPPLWAKVLLLLAGGLLGVLDFLYQHGRGRVLEAEENLAKTREALKKETIRKKAGELERLNNRKETLGKAIQEKEQIYRKLYRSLEDLSKGDGKLKQIERELSAIEEKICEKRRRERL